jgi:L-asparaginase II
MINSDDLGPGGVAMLATCIANGWPTNTYRSPDHPLQRAIRRTVEELAGEAVPATGVDGCGAPLFALTPHGLARAFRALVLASPGTPERRVADAMRAYPAWVSGTAGLARSRSRMERPGRAPWSRARPWAGSVRRFRTPSPPFR